MQIDFGVHVVSFIDDPVTVPLKTKVIVRAVAMKSTTARAIQHQRDQYIVYDSCLVQDAKAALFESLVSGVTKPLSIAKVAVRCGFCLFPEGQWVLKRYVRGGMMKNLLTDAYFIYRICAYAHGAWNLICFVRCAL